MFASFRLILLRLKNRTDRQRCILLQVFNNVADREMHLLVVSRVNHLVRYLFILTATYLSLGDNRSLEPTVVATEQANSITTNDITPLVTWPHGGKPSNGSHRIGCCQCTCSGFLANRRILFAGNETQWIEFAESNWMKAEIIIHHPFCDGKEMPCKFPKEWAPIERCSFTDSASVW